MTLDEICEEIGNVASKLAYGEIEFSYDNLMSAMKPGHPADILDDILSIIGWDVAEGIEPPIEKVTETLNELEDFQRVFKVDLKKPIRDLKNYIRRR